MTQTMSRQQRVERAVRELTGGRIKIEGCWLEGVHKIAGVRPDFTDSYTNGNRYYFYEVELGGKMKGYGFDLTEDELLHIGEHGCLRQESSHRENGRLVADVRTYMMTSHGRAGK